MRSYFLICIEFLFGEDEKVVTTQRIQPIFYNNDKRTITFTNCESLYCAPVNYKKMYIIILK